MQRLLPFAETSPPSGFHTVAAIHVLTSLAGCKIRAESQPSCLGEGVFLKL